MFQTEIDRIRASLNGGVQLRPMADRAHEFGFSGSFKHVQPSPA
jgi:hypothetical protein